MILFVNDLTVIDFSYLCAKRGVVGESWIVDLELEGSLDDASMIFDFAKVKKEVKRVIDTSLDHSLAVPTGYQGCSVSQQDDMHIVRFTSERAAVIEVAGPKPAFCFIDTDAITERSAAEYLVGLIAQALPDNVAQVRLTLRAEAINGFYYHYSHGLKKHDGNCQRIVHGHRSKIGVVIDGMNAPRWQKYWSDRFVDVYLGSEEDVVSAAQLRWLNGQHDNVYCFAYESSQGPFELVISQNVTEIVPCDTTVECLSEWLAAQTKQQVVAAQASSPSVKVFAYEGVGKGAVSVC